MRISYLCSVSKWEALSADYVKFLFNKIQKWFTIQRISYKFDRIDTRINTVNEQSIRFKDYKVNI